jgi:hypothetical protein
MKRKSFEEKQLEENLIDLDIISAEIYIELDLIYKELYSKGKWNEFVLNLDSVEATVNEDHEWNLMPENYYECLHYAFSIIDRFDEFRIKVENTNTEAKLLEGEDIEEVVLPEEALNELENLGIAVEAGHSEAPHINNDKYEDSIFFYCQTSRRMLEKMEKILETLRESKKYIFLKF